MGEEKRRKKRGVEKEDLAYFKQESSRRRCKEELGGNSFSSSPQSLFQLWIFVTLLPSSHPLFLSSNRVYPSGFFAPIFSPPAVLEEPFTAATTESVTLSSLSSLTHVFLSLKHGHTHAEILLSSSLFSNTFFSLILQFPFLSSHYILFDLFHITPPPIFSVTHHSFIHSTMCSISLSVLGTSCYLSVYPTLTSIYSFNPCWPEDISQTHPPVVITLLLSHPLIFSFLPFFSVISCHSFSPSCRTELRHISNTLLPPRSFSFSPSLSRHLPYPPLWYSLFFPYQQVRPRVPEPNEIWSPGPVCSSPALDWSQLL